ncbi:MAG: hypothetical protein AVDCRST_MAG64-1550 [uncultured Phycisphaerae bacterium]|uniref:YMGG-like Gly-zipper domain-containing protein n=1 Tax=uncultured Phycisphaerae bacterium TaxID=904963 RepID=A0A6J4NV49_9BACT|nr:MAG: hypothetical protein AVDCRST_MAG64-1550 [uncultured Phycisphaerae bacterium]
MKSFKKAIVSTALMGSLVLAPISGCSSLPGNDKQQGAVIGGVGGALAGAALSKNNRGIGALIGAALGAGGGYLIGANKDKITGKDKDRAREEAQTASDRAERNPAKPEDVDRARTADLNDDGFVTLDEVVALRQANLSDDEMVERLEQTGQVFELTDYQEDYLRTRGVSDDVLREMRNMNQDFGRTASAGDSDQLDSGDLDRDSDSDSRDRDSEYDRESARNDRGGERF